MKKKFLYIMLAFAVIITITQCNPKSDDNPNTPPVKTTACDTCTIPNEYCLIDSTKSEIYSADISITKFNVSADGAGHLILDATVANLTTAPLSDDDAHEAKLVVLLPINVCNIKVLPVDQRVLSYKQCGGQIEFCLGSIGRDSATSTRNIKIMTDAEVRPDLVKTESFAGFAYSSTPDGCPVNNYSAWVNTGSVCNTMVTVKKGFE